jgi:hypothetical protein
MIIYPVIFVILFRVFVDKRWKKSASKKIFCPNSEFAMVTWQIFLGNIPLPGIGRCGIIILILPKNIVNMLLKIFLVLGSNSSLWYAEFPGPAYPPENKHLVENKNSWIKRQWKRRQCQYILSGASIYQVQCYCKGKVSRDLYRHDFWGH